MSLIILNANELKKALPMQDAIAATKIAFAQLNHNKVEMPLRTSLTIPKYDATMLSMPAYMPDIEQLGVKIVTLFPHNPQLNSPAIHGVVLLFNAQTGQPQVLLDGAVLTAIRTGAASGLATDLLARHDAESLALIGSGAQAKTQLEAVCCVRKIKQLWIYSPTRKNAEKFAQYIENEMHLPATIHIAATASAAAKHADIICTATLATTPILSSADVNPGTHINAIGSHTAKMCELSSDLVSRARVVVDQRSAAMVEAGEIVQTLQKKLLKESDLIELGEIVNKTKPGRTSPEQITIFKSVGLAIQDISTAQQAFKNAAAMHTGVSVDL